MKLLRFILAGSIGTRLWFLSKEYYPKQFLSLAGKDTLSRLNSLMLLSIFLVFHYMQRNTSLLFMKQNKKITRNTDCSFFSSINHKSALTLFTSVLQKKKGGGNILSSHMENRNKTKAQVWSLFHLI